MKQSTILALAAAASLGALLPADDGKQDEDPYKAAAEAAARLGAEVRDKGWKDAAEEGKKLSPRHHISFVMHGFKPRGSGGVGVGTKGQYPRLDGIEDMIKSLARTPRKPEELKKMGPDLVRMAEATMGIAALAAPQPPVFMKVGEKDPAAWRSMNEEMFALSKGFIDAVKKADPRAVREAANKLNGNCVRCHKTFRES